jgi:hypothetical protein
LIAEIGTRAVEMVSEKLAIERMAVLEIARSENAADIVVVFGCLEMVVLGIEKEAVGPEMAR